MCVAHFMYENYDFTMCRVCRRCCRAHLPFASPRNRCRGVRTCWSPKVRLSSTSFPARKPAPGQLDPDESGTRKLYPRSGPRPAGRLGDYTVDASRRRSELARVLRIRDPFGNPLADLTAAHVSLADLTRKQGCAIAIAILGRRPPGFFWPSLPLASLSATSLA